MQTELQPTCRGEIAPADNSAKPLGRKRAARFRTLDLRVLLVTLAVGSVAAFVLWGIHYLQVRRIADMFLDRATALKDEKEWEKASVQLSNYLRLRPEDHIQRVTLAEYYANSVKTRPSNSARAVSLLYRALGVAPDKAKPKLHRQLADLLISSGRFQAAQYLMLKQPRTVQPDSQNRHPVADSEDQRILAIALVGRYREGALDGIFDLDYATGEGDRFGLAEFVEMAVGNNSEDAVLSSILAELYRNYPDTLDEEKRILSVAERNRLADRVMDDLVSRSPTHAAGLFARYRYNVVYHPESADADLEAALRQSPDDIEVLLASADRFRERADALLLGDDTERMLRDVDTALLSSGTLSQQQLDSIHALVAPAGPQLIDQAQVLYQQSKQYYEQILKQVPDHEGALIGAGYVVWRQNNPAGAIEIWERGAVRLPSRITFQLSLADIHRSQANFPKALQHLKEAARIARESENLVQRSLLSQQVELLHGRILVEGGKYGEAISHLQRSLAAEITGNGAPRRSFQAHSLLAASYRSLGHWELAAREFEELAKHPTGGAERLFRALAADSWLLVNRADDAVRNLEALTGRFESADTWFRIAQARFVRELQQPDNNRSFGRVQDALRKCREFDAEKNLAEYWRVVLLEAQAQTAEARSLDSEQERQTRFAEIVQRLRTAEEQFSNNPAFAKELAIVYERTFGLTEDAERVLEKLPSSLLTDAALVKAEIHSARGETEAARGVLTKALSAANGATDKTRIQMALAGLALASGDSQPAVDLFNNSATSRVGKIRLASAIAEAALARRDWGEVAKWENTLKSLEESAGVNWRAVRARRLLGIAKSGDTSTLKEIEELQLFISQQRPDWPIGHTLRGAIELRRGRRDAAIDALTRAVSLGERRVALLQDLSLLLYERNRIADADRMLSLIDTTVPRNEFLSELEFEVARRQNDLTEALEIAERRAREEPQAVNAFIRLGQARFLLGNKAAAEEAFRQAIAIDESNPQPWLALFNFYVRLGNETDARSTLSDLLVKARFDEARNGKPEENAKGSPKKALIAAQCYEILGDMKKAEENFATAAMQTADDVDSLLQLGLFKSRQRDWAGAIEVLSQAAKRDSRNPKVRYSLAAAYFGRGGVGDIDTALQTLGDVEEVGSQTDRQLRALILTRYSGPKYEEHLQEAESLLKDLVGSPETPSAANRMLLANVLTTQSLILADREAAAKKYEEAEAIYSDLLGGSGPAPSQVIAYMRFLLLGNNRDEAHRLIPVLKKSLTVGAETNDLALIANLKSLGFRNDAQSLLADMGKKIETQSSNDNAALVALSGFIALCLEFNANLDALAEPLERLESLSPNTMSTLELRARWLLVQGRANEIVPLVENFRSRVLQTLANDPQKDELQLRIGNLFVQLKMYEEAQNIYQSIGERSPQAVLGVIRTLALRRQWRNASETCSHAARSFTTPQPEIWLINHFLQSPDSANEVREIENVVNEATTKYPTDPDLMTAVANLRIRQLRVQEAVPLLEKVVAARPRNAMALNNLAVLLAEVPGRQQQALNYVHQAIQLAGPTAGILDTKGVALLHLGQTEDAIRLFRIAADLDQETCIYEFHLAIAYDMSGDSDEARSLFEAALADGIEDQILTPSDQEKLAELRSRYSQISVNATSPRS